MRFQSRIWIWFQCYFSDPDPAPLTNNFGFQWVQTQIRRKIAELRKSNLEGLQLYISILLVCTSAIDSYFTMLRKCRMRLKLHTPMQKNEYGSEILQKCTWYFHQVFFNLCASLTSNWICEHFQDFIELYSLHYLAKPSTLIGRIV